MNWWMSNFYAAYWWDSDWFNAGNGGSVAKSKRDLGFPDCDRLAIFPSSSFAHTVV